MRKGLILAAIVVFILVASMVTLIQDLSKSGSAQSQSITPSTNPTTLPGKSQTSLGFSTTTLSQSSFSTTQSQSLSSTTSSATANILLFNEFGTFTVLGNYQSDSAYSIAEVYTPNASLFVSPFLWNMKYAKGEANLTYVGHVLHVYVNFTDFQKITPSTPVDGYPGIMYGQELWFPFGRTTELSSALPLPMKVDQLPHFDSTLSYSLFVKKGVIDDFSYDIWLTQDPNTTYLTFPDVEIMVWLYHNDTLSSYFVYEGKLEVPIVVNGTTIVDNFSVYVLPHTGSANGWIGVYYLSALQLEGNVTVPLSTFIKDSFAFIDKIFPSVSANQYYLNAIQVGMEFNDINGTVYAGYTLYSWVIETS